MQVRRRISFNYYQGRAVKFIHREGGKQHVQMALAAGKETHTSCTLLLEGSKTSYYQEVLSLPCMLDALQHSPQASLQFLSG